MTTNGHRSGEQALDKKESNGSAKPLPDATITNQCDSDIHRRQQARDAIKAYRLTKDRNNTFEINMGAGQTTRDKRPLADGSRLAVPQNDKGHMGSEWLDALQHIGKLSLEQQLQVLQAGLKAGTDEYDHQMKERTLGALIGCVQGTGDVLQDLAKIADFSAYCIIADQRRAGKLAADFGTSIGQSIVGGIRLFEATGKYCQSVNEAGDIGKPFRDIQAVGQALNDKWEHLPPREQERAKAQFITELLESGAIAEAGASAIQKAGKVTEILDLVAAQAKGLQHMTQPQILKRVNAVKNLVDDLVMPTEMVTPEGVRIRIYKRTEEVDIGLLQMAKSRSERANDWQGELNREVPSSRGEHTGFRGDHDVYSPVNEKGRRKAYVNEEGDLTPADKMGVYKGRKVSIAEHIEAQYCRNAKEHSPYISFGTKNGVVAKYGGQGIELKLQDLRDAIAKGEATGVKIHEHEEVVDRIRNSYFKRYEKIRLLEFVNKDREILVEGVIPKRFITIKNAT